MSPATTPQDGIILLHGILRSARSMAPLCRFLEKQGYATCNINYPSARHSIAQIVSIIQPEIERFAGSISGSVHFIGHSMGGLVIRQLLATHPLPNLGRVVMLGTPNHGSKIADILQHWRLYRACYGPAGQQLTTAANPAPSSPIDFELGVLAGNISFDPLCNYLLGAPNDGKVTIESTKLLGMKDHRIIRATHSFFPLNRIAWKHTVQFLKTGMFAKL